MRRSPTPALLLATLVLMATASPAADVVFHLADQKHAAVADAVVSLMPLEPNSAKPAGADAPIAIEQRGQEFVPFVTVVQKGTAVRLPNQDTVEHYVYSESAAKRFQLPLYAPGKAETVTFDQTGIVVLGCNIHDWMLAYVVVVDTPWHGRTAADGRATIAGVPAGKYRAEIWHPRLGRTESRDISVEAAAMKPIAVSLTLKPDRRIRRTPTSATGGYR